MPVHLTILGSGSAGNCAYLEAGETRLLIDAGFSGRQIRQRLAGIGRSPENINGILITHEHSDHIQGLGAIAAKLGIPVYCNRLTMEAIVTIVESPLDFRIITNGSPFEIGEVGVEAFSIPHDANDPVGYLLRTNEGNIGFMTDLGHATKLVLERVRPANVLVLESNHDVKLLQECPHRPWSLKQRILGRHGHLSNDAAAEAAEQIVSHELKHLYLGHLSSQCNKPEIARRVMQQRLAQIGATHLQLQIAAQNIPAATLEL